MSKVLVDRELLDSAATWLEVHAPGGGCVEGSVAEDLRAILEQPAEAEGVEVVGYAVTWIRVGETPEETVFMSTADFEATGGPRFYSYREPLVFQSAHLAALSAVTAERDRLLSEAHGQMVEAFAERDEVIAERDRLRKDKAELKHRLTNEQQKTFVAEVQMVEIGDQRNQLRAEVEALRKDAERYRVHRSDFKNGTACDAHYDALISAAMAAKEA